MGILPAKQSGSQSKMKPMKIQSHDRYRLTMIIGGIALFIIFFFIGTFFYPGGSNFDVHTSGYRWNYNYWCELLGEYAKNGQPNEARPFGFVGMISLAFGVSCFWYFIPKKIFQEGTLRHISSFAGVLSMILSAFIFTDLHDEVIYAAVISGTLSFVTLFYGLFKLGKRGLFYAGIFCLSLILLNCFIYLTEIGIGYLPSLQKFTFLLTLLWISRISFVLSTSTIGNRI